MFRRLIRSFFFCFEPGFFKFDTELFRQLHEIQPIEQLANRFGAHVGLERHLRRIAPAPRDTLLRSISCCGSSSVEPGSTTT